ncbi:hypothetical protein ACFOYU_23030 [Microvirga sp. GCM10011540]|uniref:hypothetical protein n=1 Tax=Microvirga sp. GCM10011540 TaxID=3317338 RepID=UPI00361FFED2
MDQPYSVIADWLSKFHTWPEFIQGMLLVAVPVTVLGVTWLVMRGLRDLAAVWRGRGEATLYGVSRTWPGPPLTDRGGWNYPVTMPFSPRKPWRSIPGLKQVMRV